MTSATSHPGGTFTVGVGHQSAQITLNPNSGSSSVELIAGAPVNQSLPVAETLPVSPAGWSLVGFIVKPDPNGSATCSASEIGWEQSPSVPPDASPYLACVKDWYSAVTGTGSISGEKYHDLDADGVRDVGEPGLGGWTITATRMNGAAIDPFVTTSDSNGAFVFQNLPEGTYSVCEALQPGWIATQPSASCYTSIVAPGGEVSGLAFGNMRPGSLTVVKVDLGLNGSWTFEASGPTHPAPQTIVANGSATFSKLKPGTYAVTETNGGTTECLPGQSLPGDFETRHGVNGNAGSSVPGHVFEGIVVGSGQSVTVYFFNRGCEAVLSAPNLYVQKLSDPDGNRTGTEGLAGFKFIVKRNGNPIVGSPFTSPASGLIVLPGLDVGTYTVEEIGAPPHLFTGSKTDMGDNGTFESSVPDQPPAIELHLADVARLNFYNQLRSTIRVHKDESDQGVQRPGEGWEFTLFGCGVHTTAKTDSAGDIEWQVPHRSNCAYRVEETVRTGWLPSPAAMQDARPGPGQSVTLRFLNSREVILFIPTPEPTCTPTPTATPTRPQEPATETPAIQPTATPTSVETVVGQRTPGAPETGCGTATAGEDSSKDTLLSALSLLALVAAGGGLAYYAHAMHARRNGHNGKA